MALSMVAMGAVALAATDDVQLDNQHIDGVTDVDIDVDDDAFEEAERTERDDAVSADEDVDGVDVIVNLERADSSHVAGDTDAVVENLQSHAEATQGDLVDWAEAQPDVAVRNTFWLGNSVALTVSDRDQLDEIAEFPHVTSISESSTVEIPDLETNPIGADDDDVTYGLEMHNVPEVHDMGITGDGARVTVTDTGIDPDHPDWEDRVSEDNFNEIDADGNPVNSSPHDNHGHGTHVAGTIAGPAEPDDPDEPQYGVAPDADLYHINTLPGGSATIEQLIGALEYSLDETDPDVIAASWGGPENEAGMIDAVADIADAGVVMSASNGNNTPSTPAWYYDSFASQAIDENENPASFAIYDDEVDPEALYGDDVPDHWPEEYARPSASAAGVNVLSSHSTSGTMCGGAEYCEVSGTSMSQPHKAGTFALMVSGMGEMDRDLFQDIMEETAQDIGDDPIFGAGSIDAEAAVQQVAHDQQFEGEVTAADDSAFEGATVTVDDTGIGTTTDADGFYSIIHEAGTFDVTADGFGHEAHTEEDVELEEEENTELDFELDAELDHELLSDQDTFSLPGDTITTEHKHAHADTVTVEQLGEYDGDLTLYVDGEEADFGEAVDLEYDGWYDEVEIAVATDDETEGEVELEHTFEGEGDSITVTTGPTPVEELSGMIFTSSDDGHVYAIDGATGEEFWTSDDFGNNVRGAPVVSDGVVYATSFAGNVKAIDAGDGETIWENTDGESLFSNPTVSEEEGLVFTGDNVGLGDGAFMAIDIDSGELEWEFTDPTDNVGGAPLVVDGDVYFGSADGTFWSLDAQTGDVNWELTGDDFQGVSPNYLQSEDLVIAADRGAGEVMALDPETGDEEWSNNDPGLSGVNNLGSFAVNEQDEHIYIGEDEGAGSAVYAIDFDGETVWTNDDSASDSITTSVTYHDGMVFFGDTASNVYGLDAEDGEEIWSESVDDEVHGEFTAHDGIVYTSSGAPGGFTPPGAGTVYAFDAESGDEIWTYEAGAESAMFGGPTFADDTADLGFASTGTAALQGTDGHNDLFPYDPHDQQFDGTVEASDGSGHHDADVEVDQTGASASTDDDGHYTLGHEVGTWDLTADGFGHAPATEEGVELGDNETVTVDFALDAELDHDLIADQQEIIEGGDTIETVHKAAHADTVTVEELSEYAGNLTLYVDGEEADFGEPVDLELDGWYDEVEVAVSTESGVAGDVELEHTFEGEGDSITATTGPTEVLEELREAAVIDDTEGYGDDWVEILEAQLGDVYETIEHVDAEDALEDLDAYDTYFVHGLDDGVVDEWFDETDGVSTVYTSQNLGPDTLGDRSGAIGDPDDVTTSTSLATWTVDEEHDIFDGIAEPGDDITVHTDSFGDGASFDGTDADVIASQEDGDHGIAVDYDRDDVMLTAVGFGWVNPGDHTDEALEVLANSLDYFVDDEPAEPTDTVMTIEDANVSEHVPGDVTNVTAESDEAIAGFQTFVEFDTDKVSIEGVEERDFDTIAYEYDNDEGWLRIAGAAAEGMDDPTLAGIEFDTDLEPAEETTLELTEDSVLNDDQGAKLDTALEDGTIKALHYNLGDVLNDGEIHSGDAVVVQAYLAGLDLPVPAEQVETYGDVTQTGEVTSADVTYILQYVTDPDHPGFTPAEDGDELTAIGPTAPAAGVFG